MHFAPYTKLFLEKQWTNFHADKILENYGIWKEYIQRHHENIHQIVTKPVDILITTDVLSEGQNLQDADMVINYDVHWNPVRVIQRFGRVDRIGSPNDTIECINFWPAKSINDYINLKKRVETRMAVMQFIGSEVIKDFTDDFAQMAENPLEQKQNEHLLKQMEGKIEDLDGEHSLGFDDFSFDIYKQQLYDTIQSKSKEMLDLPNGIFSGFEVKSMGDLPQGIIVLLGLKPKKDNGYASHHLVYLKDDDGLPYSDNMKVVLEIINQYKNEDRIVPKNVESGDSPALLLWQSHIEKWIESQHTEYTADEDGNIQSVAGKADLDLLNAIKGGSKSAINQIKESGTASDRYRKENFDVITWLIVS
ncbi:MAG: SWF/SNF helicase family protein [Saprospiraceae bacterium]|nr:SWF/SNF helicase family protein [Saprospiraceae bacterium]